MKLKNNQILLILIIIVLLSGIILRCIYLNSDPLYISWSKGSYTDIGFYTVNARNKILFNNFKIGDWDNRILFPVYNYLIYSLMYIFGLSFAKLNMFTITISTLAFIILSLYHKNYKFKFYIIYLFSFNFIYFCISRISYIETYAILFIIISLYFLKNLNFKNIIFFGIFSLLSILTKPTSVFILPLAVIYIIINFFKKDFSFKLLISYICIILCIPVIISLYYYYAKNNYNTAILNYTIFNKPAHINNINLFTILNTNLFCRIPIISLSFFCYLTYIFIHIKKISSYNLIMLLWIIIYYAQLTLSVYAPLRYYILIIPPIIYFSAKFFINYKTVITDLFKHKIIILPFIFIGSYNVVWTYYRSILDKHIFLNDLLFNSIILGLTIYFVYLTIARFSILKKVIISKYTIFILLTLNLTVFILQYKIYFLDNIRFDLINTGNNISQTINTKNSVLSGWYAAQLGLMNNNLKIIPSYNMSHKYLSDNKVTHLILESKKNNNNFSKFNIQLIKKYYIKNIKKKLYLYEIIN